MGGELDLCIDCYTNGPIVEGLQLAMKTIFIAWLPLVLAGIVLKWKNIVHPAMRGAGPLRELARVAIAILVASVMFPVMAVAMVAMEVGGHFWGSVFAAAVALAITLPIAALSGVGIQAWLWVQEELSSRPGERRMLV